jgi:hypothetical protein
MNQTCVFSNRRLDSLPEGISGGDILRVGRLAAACALLRTARIMSAFRSLLFFAVAALLFLAPPLAGGLRDVYAPGEGDSSMTLGAAEPQGHVGHDEHDGSSGFAGHMHDWASASDHSHEAGGLFQLQSAGRPACTQSWQSRDAARRWPCLLIAFERPPRPVVAS